LFIASWKEKENNKWSNTTNNNVALSSISWLPALNFPAAQSSHVSPACPFFFHEWKEHEK
jgi:hypothetical protein